MDAHLTIAEIKSKLSGMTEKELAKIDLLISHKIWIPISGPQTEAYNCEADELFYGGAGGGGKTDLLLGLALTAHYRSIIFRRESPQLQGILDRLHNEILKTTDGYSSLTKIHKLGGGKQIEFGSCSNIGDEIKYAGRPHDALLFDEITHFIQNQYLFLTAWNRTTRKGQRCRIVCTGNPPTDSDGEWVIKYWGAWLDDLHPKYPTPTGQLRWYATLDGKDTEVESGAEFKYGSEIIKPKSRTFIPSKVQDNPFLMDTGYMSTLQALPEPLRSQMLFGDFKAGAGDDPWQVLPTEWVKAAQDRWEPRSNPGYMNSVGVDVARGGMAKTIISRRHGNWFDELLAYPGKATPDGQTVVGLIIAAIKDNCQVNIDVIGVGTSVYDHAKGLDLDAHAVNGAGKSTGKDKTGKLLFRNMRAEMFWRMREALDPVNNSDIALPPDSELRADLCVARWKLTPGGILIESKEDLIKRIGRSPDKGDAVCLNFFNPGTRFSPIDIDACGV